MTQHPRAHRIRLGLLAVPAAGALILGGCSATPSTGETEGASQSFSFTFATSNNLESPYQTLADAYMEANEGVTIETNPTPNDRYGDTIRTQLQAGNASDVVQTTPGSGDARGLIPLAEAGFLAPLGETAAGLVPVGSEPIFQIDGETYGQAIDFTVVGMIASMGTAGQSGIAEFPTDFAEFLAACESLASEGKSMIAFAGAAPPNVGLTIQALSATRVFAETPDWNAQREAGEVTFADSEEWRDTLQTFVDLNERGCFQPGAEGAGFDAITNGLSQGTSIGSFAPSGAAVEISRAAPPEAEIVVQPFPTADGGDPYVIASSNYTISLNAAAENAEAATAFIEWLATPEAQQIYFEASGELPSAGYEELDLEETIYAPVVDLIESESYTPLPGNVWPNPAVMDAMQVGGQGLLTGQATIDQVLASLDAAWGE